MLKLFLGRNWSAHIHKLKVMDEACIEKHKRIVGSALHLNERLSMCWGMLIWCAHCCRCTRSEECVEEVVKMVVQEAQAEFQLQPHAVVPRGKPFLLVVLDGWGENREDEFNAIYKAECPTIKALKEGAPRRWRTIKAHGTAVGLPSDGDMGNSEVGHNAMGAGKIIQQG